MSFSKNVQKKFLRIKKYDNLNDHLNYRYHKLFFGKLIKKSLKLQAFNNFLKLKVMLKKEEKFDPNTILFLSFLKITPLIMLVPVRLGASFHGAPLPITEKKKVTFAAK